MKSPTGSICGKILDTVHQQGFKKHTILFISDNGGLEEQDTLYDTGIHPDVAVWEGHVAPGSFCPHLVTPA